MKTIKTAEYTIKIAAWGRAGAGILFICKQDGSAMLLLRSSRVEDPGLWGVPGGAVKGTEGYYNDDNANSAGQSFPKEQLWNTAKEETEEEIGSFPQQYTVHPDHIVYDTNPRNPNSFKYYTFVVDIPLSEKQKIESSHSLNWENDELQWYPIQTLMSKMKADVNNPHPIFDNGNLHKGVAHVLDNHPEFKRQLKTKKKQIPNQQQESI